jgi:hypothetical protein
MSRSDRLKTGDTILGGYVMDEKLQPVRESIDTTKGGDYGCDPLPDGAFRMVPSGDIVDYAERNRRLES